MDTCQVCLNLHPDSVSALRPGQRAVWFVTIADLKNSTSMSQPCPECTLIWKALLLYKTSWDERETAQSAELRIAVGAPLQLFFRGDGVYLELFSRKLSEDKNSAAATRIPVTIGPATEVSEVSSSDSCFSTASSWLQTCVQSHPSCCPKAPPPLPTRVIDVGKGDAQEPFLFETHGQTGNYAALSYCWGDPKAHRVLKTDSETLEKHKRCIEFSSLPKTLQDAVIITRRLGLRYLWVDALCIIQGDRADWARESGHMSDVYSNSYLTISADNSSGSSDGIFSKQKFGAPPNEIKYKDGTVIYVRKEFAREQNNYGTLLRDEFSPEPITCRAWTLQEGLLSNRILRYTSNELVWECNEWRFYEHGYGSAAIDLDDEASNRAIRKPETFGILTPEKIYLKWYEVLSLFSQRQLGYEEDKLPALSGLADQFAALLKLASPSGQDDQYLAGLWRSNLAKSLLWSIEDDLFQGYRAEKEVYHRPEFWRAPSWSWTSLKRPVMMAELPEFKSCIEIVEASTVAATLNPLGKLKSARLIVIGRLVHGVGIEIDEHPTNDYFTGYTQGKKFSVQSGDMLRTFLYDDSGADLSALRLAQKNGHITCFLVGTVQIYGTSVEDVFLVLRRKEMVQSTPLEDVGMGVYERIGVSLRQYRAKDVHMVGTGTRAEHSSSESSDGKIGLFTDAQKETIMIV